MLADLREAGTLTILDVKRGDIGSTMQAYADAYLGPDSDLRADAVTVSPFLGYASLRPALDLAEETGRGVFVLALTSNPEGREVQHAEQDGRSVAASVVAGAAADNAAAGRGAGSGSVGLVVGATVGDALADLGLDLVAAGTPVLAPGYGAQGGTVEALRRAFGPALPQVLASSQPRGALRRARTWRRCARRPSTPLLACAGRSPPTGGDPSLRGLGRPR